MTNLLFRHRIFASVNSSCVCNMFVVCVKRTVGTLLSVSSTFSLHPFHTFLILFFRRMKYIKLRHYLFSCYYHSHTLFTCRLYLYVCNNFYRLSFGLNIIVFHFLIYLTRFRKSYWIEYEVLLTSLNIKEYWRNLNDLLQSF